MKIQFLKTVAVDIETQFGEIYSKGFSRWDELRIKEILICGSYATLITETNEYVLNVPLNTFEKIQAEKPILL